MKHQHEEDANYGSAFCENKFLSLFDAADSLFTQLLCKRANSRLLKSKFRGTERAASGKIEFQASHNIENHRLLEWNKKATANRNTRHYKIIKTFPSSLLHIFSFLCCFEVKCKANLFLIGTDPRPERHRLTFSFESRAVSLCVGERQMEE